MEQVGTTPELVRLILNVGVFSRPNYSKAIMGSLSVRLRIISHSGRKKQGPLRETGGIFDLMVVSKLWFFETVRAYYIVKLFSTRELDTFISRLEQKETDEKYGMSKLLEGFGVCTGGTFLRELETRDSRGGRDNNEDAPTAKILAAMLSPLGVPAARCQQLAGIYSQRWFDHSPEYLPAIRKVSLLSTEGSMVTPCTIPELCRRAALVAKLPNLASIAFGAQFLVQDWIRCLSPCLEEVLIYTNDSFLLSTEEKSLAILKPGNVYNGAISRVTGRWIAQRCPHVKCVRLRVAYNESTSTESRQHIDQFLDSFPKLSQVELDAPQPGVRKMGMAVGPSMQAVISRPLDCLKVRHFDIFADRPRAAVVIRCKKLHVLMEFGQKGLEMFLDRLCGVEQLNLALCLHGNSLPPYNWPIDLLACKLKNLKSLVIDFRFRDFVTRSTCATPVSLEGFEQLARNSPELGLFYISNWFSGVAQNVARATVTDSHVKQFAQAAPKLDTFVLAGHGLGLTEAANTSLQAHCPLLKRCYIYNPRQGSVSFPPSNPEHWINTLCTPANNELGDGGTSLF